MDIGFHRQAVQRLVVGADAPGGPCGTEQDVRIRPGESVKHRFHCRAAEGVSPYGNRRKSYFSFFHFQLETHMGARNPFQVLCAQTVGFPLRPRSSVVLHMLPSVAGAFSNYLPILHKSAPEFKWQKAQTSPLSFT